MRTVITSLFLASSVALAACGGGHHVARSLPSETDAKARFSLSPAEIAARAMPAIVTVKSDTGFGTGFVVKKDGWIATNFHVVEGARALTVVVPDRGEFAVEEMMVLDRDMDLAVVRIAEKDLPVLTIGDSTAVRAGDPIVAIGHPLGFDHTISNGLVSAIRSSGSASVFQISAPIAPGSSGGPLLDDRGEVIGVTMSTVKGGQNLNFGVPISYLKEALLHPEPVSFEAFAKANRPAMQPPKDRKVPHHEVAMLRGCADGDLLLAKALIQGALDDAFEAYRAERFPMVDHVLEGATLDIERRLSEKCVGPKRALGEARRNAAKTKDPIASAWAIRDGFDGLTDVIDRKVKE